MKRFTFLALAAAMLAMLLTGCGSSDSSDRYNGNVSTTDNGKVNGTNDNMTGEFVGEEGFSENNGSGNNSGANSSENTTGTNSNNGGTNSNGSNNGNDAGNGNDSNAAGNGNSGNAAGNDNGGNTGNTEGGLDNRGRTRSRSGWTSGSGDASSWRSGNNVSPN